MAEVEIRDLTADAAPAATDVIPKQAAAGGAGSTKKSTIAQIVAAAAPQAHAVSHTDGSDDIQDATAAQKGLATATQITKLDGIATGADVTGANAPQAHAASHQDGGSDELPVASLAESAAPGNDVSQALRPDGAGGVAFSDVDFADLTGQAATAQIADEAITNPKLRNSFALSVIGRGVNAIGEPKDIVAADPNQILARAADSLLAFQQVSTDMVANNAITNTKLADMAQALIKGRSKTGGTGDPQDLTATQVRAIIAILKSETYPWEVGDSGEVVVNGTDVKAFELEAATFIRLNFPLPTDIDLSAIDPVLEVVLITSEEDDGLTNGTFNVQLTARYVANTELFSKVLDETLAPDGAPITIIDTLAEMQTIKFTLDRTKMAAGDAVTFKLEDLDTGTFGGKVAVLRNALLTYRGK